MKKELKAIAVLFTTMVVVAFLVGMLEEWMMFTHPEHHLVITFLGMSCAIIVIFGFIVYHYILRHFRKRKGGTDIMSKSLTTRMDDGSYALDPANIYEAIEKLGYIEHEGGNLYGKE